MRCWFKFQDLSRLIRLRASSEQEPAFRAEEIIGGCIVGVNRKVTLFEGFHQLAAQTALHSEISVGV